MNIEKETRKLNNLLPPEGAEAIDINELVGVFVDKRWVILSIAIIFFLGGLVIFGLMPNKYEAKTLLLVETPPKEVYINAQEYKDLMVMPQKPNEFYETQMTLIKSSSMLNKLADRVDSGSLARRRKVSLNRKARMVEMFRKQINVRRITYSQLIEISTTSNDPVLAAKLTNTLGEIYAGEYKERILSMTKELARMIQSEKQSGEANEQAYEALENILGVNKASKIGRLKASRDDTQKLLDELSVNYKEGHPQINALNNKIHELDAEMNQEINNALQNWENSLALHGKHLLSTVTIAEYAEVPKKPIGPKRFRGILFFSFLGLASGCGFVFILYQLDPRIRSEEDLIKETGLTSLGVVPRVASDIPLDDFSRLPQELKDIFAYIRTTVLFSMPEGKSKVILLTSVLRSEGRTTIATNLACSFANDGLKTVLIDADTREARAHSVFNLRKTPGLTNFLKGEINTDAILLNSGIQNLTVVPAGDPVSNPSELLSQVKMAELMKSLKEKFDKVIIDTPPVLNIADEFVLASLADGVVLVIDSEKSDERVLRRVVNEFRQMNETLLGGIINQYDISKHRNYLDVYFKFEKDFSQISGRVVREQLLKLFPKK